jgi:hypothetical protein
VKPRRRKALERFERLELFERVERFERLEPPEGRTKIVTSDVKKNETP